MTAVIAVAGLTKHYAAGLFGSPRVALRGVDLRVEAGEGIALLGPNGAGKSTLLLVLSDLRRPSGGTVRLFGRDARDASVRLRIGVLPERPALAGSRGVTQLLRTLLRLRGDDGPETGERIRAMLARLGLEAQADTPLDALSQGTRQRVALAQALLHQPDLLLLDEPLANLDPPSVRLVVDVLATERARGATLIVATHRLADLAPICTRVARMTDGTLSELGPTHAVLASLPCRILARLPSGELVTETADAGDRDEAVARVRAGGAAILRIEPRIELLTGAPEAAP